jgi:hypothetical protein
LPLALELILQIDAPRLRRLVTLSVLDRRAGVSETRSPRICSACVRRNRKPAREYTPENACKRWGETWAAGQSLYAVNAVEPVAAVVDALERDYRNAVARFAERAPTSQPATP